ncbi:unnamed protein product [Microthlaspi erraticum]|nr:unnamed protein product [Microthlaspi erraticum]CAA7041436.1 unnamed protein product [Microthlaspi erraticum]
MAHRHTFEALDRTLRDIKRSVDPLATEKTFGGITMLLGGDFRQILPVIARGSRQDTVMASINRSYLWDRRNVCLLKKNMRLNADEISFSKWILEVGDGVAKRVSRHWEDSLDTDIVEVENELLLQSTSDSLEDVFRSTYVDFERFYREKNYLRERAILTPRNDTMDEVNEFILSKGPGEMKEYFSSDTLSDDD